MKNIEIEIYDFKELSKEVQEKLIDKNRNINVDFDWWEDSYIHFETIFGLMGVEIKNINFSGFSSQGDGASFTGTYSFKEFDMDGFKEEYNNEELNKLAQRFIDIQADNNNMLTAISNRNFHNYSHENTIDVTFWHKETGESMDCEELEELLKNCMQYIYKFLEKEYEGLTSNDSVREQLICAEHEYFKDGSIYQF